MERLPVRRKAQAVDAFLEKYDIKKLVYAFIFSKEVMEVYRKNIEEMERYVRIRSNKKIKDYASNKTYLFMLN